TRRALEDSDYASARSLRIYGLDLSIQTNTNKQLPFKSHPHATKTPATASPGVVDAVDAQPPPPSNSRAFQLHDNEFGSDRKAAAGMLIPASVRTRSVGVHRQHL